MILCPGLYPINGFDLDLLTAVLVEWCGNRNRYECYLNVPKYGPPILCRPLDELAIAMLGEVKLLNGPRGPRPSSRTRLSLVE